MTITNHLLAGASIALVIHQPELAIFLAYCSHFVMDAIPHFGYPAGSDFLETLKNSLKHRLTYPFFGFTIVSFLSLIIFLIAKHRYLALVAGLTAASPDSAWLINYIFYERKKKVAKGRFAHFNLKFHAKIQTERPWGIITEMIAFGGLLTLALELIY